LFEEDGEEGVKAGEERALNVSSVVRAGETSTSVMSESWSCFFEEEKGNASCARRTVGGWEEAQAGGAAGLEKVEVGGGAADGVVLVELEVAKGFKLEEEGGGLEGVVDGEVDSSEPLLFCFLAAEGVEFLPPLASLSINSSAVTGLSFCSPLVDSASLLLLTGVLARERAVEAALRRGFRRGEGEARPADW
jgi:hypothetical protein